MSHRILIIDDEAGIRQALKQVLDYEGMTVRVAASGGEGISIYQEFRPHLVFLDVKMAGLDGLETLSRLRDLDPAAPRGNTLHGGRRTAGSLGPARPAPRREQATPAPGPGRPASPRGRSGPGRAPCGSGRWRRRWRRSCRAS